MKLFSKYRILERNDGKCLAQCRYSIFGWMHLTQHGGCTEFPWILENKHEAAEAIVKHRDDTYAEKTKRVHWL